MTEADIRADERQKCIAELEDPKTWEIKSRSGKFLDALGKGYIARAEYVGACVRVLRRGLPAE